MALRTWVRQVAGKNRPYVQLGHADGGNYAVFTWDFENPNPVVYICDAVDDWNEANRESRTGQKIGSLAMFLKKLRPETKKAGSKKSRPKKTLEPRRLVIDKPPSSVEGAMTPNFSKKLRRNVQGVTHKP